MRQNSLKSRALTALVCSVVKQKPMRRWSSRHAKNLQLFFPKNSFLSQSVHLCDCGDLKCRCLMLYEIVVGRRNVPSVALPYNYFDFNSLHKVYTQLYFGNEPPPQPHDFTLLLSSERPKRANENKSRTDMAMTTFLLQKFLLVCTHNWNLWMESSIALKSWRLFPALKTEDFIAQNKLLNQDATMNFLRKLHAQLFVICRNDSHLSIT